MNKLFPIVLTLLCFGLNVIPDIYEGYFTGFIGEGVASVQITPGVWVGSLTQLEKNKGYWVNVTQSIDLNFDQP